MSNLSELKITRLKKIDKNKFTKYCVGCLVVSREGEIVLQQRDKNCHSFPGCISTFGGEIESNETPMQALIRELKEELGADVKERDVVILGMITEEENNKIVLLYVYFWQDKRGTITGCYEGRARYYTDAVMAESHPKVMNDVKWLIKECKKMKLL